MAAVKYHEGQFPPSGLDLPRILPRIEQASAAVARYEGVLHGIPNAQVLLSPLTSQEAVLSSKIEGTQATLGEVLEFEADQESATGEKRNDIQEILNYRRAMRFAVDAMKTLSLSQRMVCDTHEILMDGVRGQNKAPGQYRRIPNWIGPAGCEMESARYIPPEANRVEDLMWDWQNYLNDDEVPAKLVQLAVVHAEFEAIHPFLDGNGRMGRLLVPLFLVDKKFLSTPDFYISAYLEAHREQYYERLLAVSRDNDWTGWCVFFLTALIEQARDNESKAKAVLDLYHTKKDWMIEKTHSQHAIPALDWFFSRPIFKTSDFVASAGIPKPTANRIVRIVRDEGLLREIHPARGRRPAILSFEQLLDIVEDRPGF